MISNESSISKMIDFISASNSSTLVISHLLHRDIGGCLERCGGCCKRVTLDYLESSERWQRFKQQFPDKISDFIRFPVGDDAFYSNAQETNNSGFCQYLDLNSGLCSIHIARPLLCQSTPLKFKFNPTRNRVLLTSETYGRKHAFKRVDGEKGAKCTMLVQSEKRKQEDIELLEELVCIGHVLCLDVSRLKEIILLLKTRSLESGSITLTL